ncbi:MAG: hypothetical protein QW806_09255 [Nitrososphaerota archaeon]
MKALMLLERYVLANMIYGGWSKILDQKLKALQKYVYGHLYDKKMITEHINFLKESLLECKKKKKKVKKKLIENTGNVINDDETNDEMDTNKISQAILKRTQGVFVDINPFPESFNDLEMLVEHVTLETLNKLSESNKLNTIHFESDLTLKKDLLLTYFLPSNMEKYLLESSKKQNKTKKIEDLEKIISYIIR